MPGPEDIAALQGRIAHIRGNLDMMARLVDADRVRFIASGARFADTHWMDGSQPVSWLDTFRQSAQSIESLVNQLDRAQAALKGGTQTAGNYVAEFVRGRPYTAAMQNAGQIAQQGVRTVTQAIPSVVARAGDTLPKLISAAEANAPAIGNAVRDNLPKLSPLGPLLVAGKEAVAPTRGWVGLVKKAGAIVAILTLPVLIAGAWIASKTSGDSPASSAETSTSAPASDESTEDPALFPEPVDGSSETVPPIPPPASQVSLPPTPYTTTYRGNTFGLNPLDQYCPNTGEAIPTTITVTGEVGSNVIVFDLYAGTEGSALYVRKQRVVVNGRQEFGGTADSLIWSARFVLDDSGNAVRIDRGRISGSVCNATFTATRSR